MADHKKMGELLRKFRENSGFSVEEISLVTRISIHLVKALEEGELSVMPGEVFTRGFIRNLCRAYNADPSELLRLLETAPEAGVVSKVESQSVLLKSKKNELLSSEEPSAPLIPRRWLVGILASMAATSAWLVMVDRTPPEPVSVPISVESPQSPQLPEAVEKSDEEVVVVEEPKISPSMEKQSEVSPPASQDIIKTSVSEVAPSGELVLRILVKDPVQIKLRTDKEASQTLTLEAKEHRFSFKSQAELMIYDASAVEVFFDEQSLGVLGQKGRIRRLTFVKSLPSEIKSASF